MTPAEFVRARLDKSLAAARDWLGLSTERRAKMLRQVAALRKLADGHEPQQFPWRRVFWFCRVCDVAHGSWEDHRQPWCDELLTLASIWSDHPDYDPAWSDTPKDA